MTGKEVIAGDRDLLKEVLNISGKMVTIHRKWLSFVETGLSAIGSSKNTQSGGRKC
jgi:hypothetical protein